MANDEPDFDTLIRRVEAQPVPLARLACLLLARGQDARARHLITRAISLAPDNPEVQTLSADILTYNMHNYYFRAVRDHARNVAMDRALRHAIRPGYRVLEIGTGTGLFAMMAARAGAKEVISCEINASVAATATQIIAKNGYSDRVRVIPKSSTDLEIGVDLSAPADLLILDTLGSNLIGCGALPLVENAKRRLMRPCAKVIPARGSVRVALAEDREANLRRLHIVEAFDLSPFNRLAVARYPLSPEDERLILRSDAQDLFRFDFQSGGPFPEAQASLSVTTFGGRVNGIAQWLAFEFDDEVQYENSPIERAFSAFSIVFHSAQPIEMGRATTVYVRGAHDRETIRAWIETA